MTNPSHDSAPGSVPLFTYTVDKTARRLALGDKPSWRFPCGLCNSGTVSEPGALCGQCAPSAEPPRKPRTRASTKTAAKQTQAKQTGSAKKTTGTRVPPWGRVADQPDDQGQTGRSGKRGES